MLLQDIEVVGQELDHLLEDAFLYWADDTSLYSHILLEISVLLVEVSVEAHLSVSSIDELLIFLQQHLVKAVLSKLIGRVS